MLKVFSFDSNLTHIVCAKMTSFSRSSSEDSEQERESEDSDRILMEGGPVEPYQDEPLAVDNSDSDESDSEEDEDGLSPAF